MQYYHLHLITFKVKDQVKSMSILSWVSLFYEKIQIGNLKLADFMTEFSLKCNFQRFGKCLVNK